MLLMTAAGLVEECEYFQMETRTAASLKITDLMARADILGREAGKLIEASGGVVRNMASECLSGPRATSLSAPSKTIEDKDMES